MSTALEGRLPVSPANAVIVGLFLAGALVTALAGRWGACAVLVAMGAGGFATALYARRPGARDITRVNAIEYRDERDRRIAQAGFSAVGAFALALSLVEFVAVVTVGGSQGWHLAQLVTAAQVCLLAVVWGVANSVAVRRS
jgi:hypothetical protein